MGNTSGISVCIREEEKIIAGSQIGIDLKHFITY
jgi:hypothetical protein